MKCPHCGSDNWRVVKTHPDGKGAYDDTIKRRRECLNCKKRFDSYESLDKNTSKLTDPVTYSPSF